MFQVVPHRVTTESAEVFVGAFFDEAPPEVCTLRLESPVHSREFQLFLGSWSTLSGDGHSAIHHVRHTFRGLPAATSFELRLLGPGQDVLAEGTVETMPLELPQGDQGSGPYRPFTIWLSSCFYAPRAPSGLEQMVKGVVRDARIKPHLKIHAGDQVYLDFPQTKIALFGQERLRQHFNQVYTNSWTHPAFSELLSNGGNFFLADDHEFWNDYPEALLPLLWQLRGRGFHDAWERLARERFAALQDAAPTQRLDIGGSEQSPPELSIFLAQTRIDRGRGRKRFMTDAALAELIAWLDGLQSPGILALTQPVIAYASDDEGSLPDYRQFREELEPALARAKCDVIIVTGDPHFGRIGVVHYEAEEGIPEHRLIEVIASPLTLVTPLAGAARPQLPPTFPHYGPKSKRWSVEYPALVPSYQSGRYTLAEEHAMLLSFHKNDAGQLRLRVMLRLARQDTPADEWVWQTELSGSRA